MPVRMRFVSRPRSLRTKATVVFVSALVPRWMCLLVKAIALAAFSVDKERDVSRASRLDGYLAAMVVKCDADGGKGGADGAEEWRQKCLHQALDQLKRAGRRQWYLVQSEGEWFCL